MYKIVTSGISKEVPLNELSRNLKVQSEVYALSDREIYLGLISHKTLVFFATEFADYALQSYTKKKIPKVEECIYLVRKWIENPNSVSKKKLNAAAADATYAAATYAAYTTNAVTYAAYATNAVTYAAYAHAAAAASNAAAAGVDKEKEFERQGEFILDFLKSGNHLFLV